MVLLRQLSYAIKTQLKAPKSPLSLWHKDGLHISSVKFSASLHLLLLGRIAEIECPWFTEARLHQDDMTCADLVENDPEALFFYIMRREAFTCVLQILPRPPESNNPL